MPQPIPALIVSGYLGSGKTTLVQHLLTQAQREGVKLAIISNEFGDTGIDRALMGLGVEGLVELDGGCVCCKLSDALGETLTTLLTQVRPDRLVLETSGAALPSEVLIQFWREPISQLVSDEVVVVVVDGEHLANNDVLEPTLLEQIESADLCLLNKCDLLSPNNLHRATERLAALSGGQPVIESTYTKVDPALLFPPDPKHIRQRRRDPGATPAPHTHEHFTTVEIPFPGIQDPQLVLDRVAREQAVRAKGFVRTPNGLQVLQGVGARITLSPAPQTIPESLAGRVVVIRRAASTSTTSD